jgi:hypothetical protein
VTEGTSRTSALIGLAVGLPLIGFGLAQFVVHKLDTVHIALWLAGGVALHDFVLVPAVFLAGGLLRRVAGRSVLAPLQVALIVSGLLLLFSLPALSGKGVTGGDTSRLPGDYPRAVAGLLIAIWAAAAVWALLARRRGGA